MLPKTKNRDVRVVYLNEFAMQVIRSVGANGGSANGKLFEGIEGARASLAFLRICRRLGIQDFRLHDLRHTAGSWLRMQGSDIHTVADLLGHKDLRMARRYQHLTGEYLASAVRRIDDLLPALPLQQKIDTSPTRHQTTSEKKGTSRK